MGAILDLLKDIPLSAVMKERLAQAEQEIVSLKANNALLKTQNGILASKAQNLETLLSQPKKQQPGDPCPYCRHQTGELQRLERNPVFDLHGVSDGHYKCSNCGKTYQKQINALPGN